MRYYKIIIFTVFSIAIFSFCKKHESLPDLEIKETPSNVIVYPYGANVMLRLDSSRIVPWGTTSSFYMMCYVGVRDTILAQYATKYSKIAVYDGSSLFGNLPYPNKSYGKIVTSGQVYIYHYCLIDTAGVASVSSPQYTITIP